MKTTVFKSGNSQCVRIPKDLRFPEGVEEASIEQDEAGRLVLVPLAPDPDLAKIRDLWEVDPRAAFEKVLPEERRIFPKQGMQVLLRAGVLPFSQKPNSIDTSSHTPPKFNLRWSFWFEGYGWLDGWTLLNQLKHEDYLVVALVGLGVPFDKIAEALSMVSSRSAWSGLGGVGWLWTLSQTHGRKDENDMEDISWAAKMPGLVELGEFVQRALKTGGKP